MEKYSLSDIAALLGNRNGYGDNFLEGNGILVILFFFMAMTGGFGGFGGWGGNGAFANGALTRAEMFDGFNNQDTQRKLDGLANGLCDGFYAINNTLLQTSNQTQRDLCQGFNAIGSQVAENRFANQQCCCNLERNVDAVRYEAAQNTCAITTNATANTQAILDKLCAMESNAKDQRIADLTTSLQTANFQLSQQAQNSTLINALKPCPIPAYNVPNPFTGYYGYNNNYGCGCGCNGGY